MNMTSKERMDLGLHLARTQTLVMKAFRTGLDPNRLDQIDVFVTKFTATLVEASQDQRFQIMDGTELCIEVMSDRYRQNAQDDLQAERATRTERALDLAVSRAIDRLAEMEMTGEYESPSFAFG